MKPMHTTYTNERKQSDQLFQERSISQKILRELLEMLDDEENFVKLEAFEQMNTIFIDFHADCSQRS